MIEVFGDQLPEEQMADAIMLAQREIAKICELQEELCAKVGKQRTPAPVRVDNPAADSWTLCTPRRAV